MSDTIKLINVHQNPKLINTESDETFNEKMKELAIAFQEPVDELHNILKDTPFESIPPQENQFSWTDSLNVTGHYDPSLHEHMNFLAIEFAKCGSPKRNRKNKKEENEEDEDSTSQLSDRESRMIAELFDDADENGDGYLTSSEIKEAIEAKGGLVFIFDTLGWLEEVDKLTHKEFENFLQLIQTNYDDAVDLDEFTELIIELFEQSRIKHEEL